MDTAVYLLKRTRAGKCRPELSRRDHGRPGADLVGVGGELHSLAPAFLGQAGLERGEHLVVHPVDAAFEHGKIRAPAFFYAHNMPENLKPQIIARFTQSIACQSPRSFLKAE